MATILDDINQELVEGLLGRSLTEVESTNFELYKQVAVERLDNLLCIDLAGMDDIPADLQLLIARCFAVIGQEQEASGNFGVSSKKVEDFSINYHAEAFLETSPMATLVKQNASTIDKYGQCQAKIRSGKVCYPYGDCFRCF